MKGYYKNPIATEKVLDKEGWLDTGDIGWLVPQSSIGAGRHCGGMLVLEGRAKDTIVLSTVLHLLLTIQLYSISLWQSSTHLQP